MMMMMMVVVVVMMIKNERKSSIIGIMIPFMISIEAKIPALR